MAAVIVAGGFAVAAASTVRKLQSAAGSKGVEHILSKEERDRLAAKHEEKIREHAGPGGMKAGLSSSLYAAKDLVAHKVPLAIGRSHPVYPGETAPNPKVFTVDAESEWKCVDLLSFAKAGRPLVLNFGSYSSPVFREAVEDWKGLQGKFADLADFLFVYIEEAHPADGWSIEWNTREGVNVTKARCLEEKIESASLFAGALKVPVAEIAVDNMDAAASKAYRALPERLFVVTDGVVKYCGGIT